MPRFLSLADPTSSASRVVHAVLTGTAYKRLVVSALPGLRPDGSLPVGAAAQAEQAFDNLAVLIATAGLGRDDLVRVATYMVGPGAESAVHSIAAARFGTLRPTMAVRHVNALSQSGHLIEIDAEAVREN